MSRVPRAVPGPRHHPCKFECEINQKIMKIAAFDRSSGQISAHVEQSPRFAHAERNEQAVVFDAARTSLARKRSARQHASTRGGRVIDRN
jgi:hypothetical protein